MYQARMFTIGLVSVSFFPLVFLYDSSRPKHEQQNQKWTNGAASHKRSVQQRGGNLLSETVFKATARGLPHPSPDIGTTFWVPTSGTKTHKSPHIVETQMASAAAIWPDYIFLLALVLVHVFSG